jgi:hypothetical protein
MSRAIALGTIGLLGILWGCLKPPLAVVKQEDGVEVSVETLGEYPTSISRIQLKDSDKGAVIWEVTARDRVPQLWGFHLSPGLNFAEPAALLHGQYEIVIPKGSSAFMLQKGRRYELSVWNEMGTRKESTDFTL